ENKTNEKNRVESRMTFNSVKAIHQQDLTKSLFFHFWEIDRFLFSQNLSINLGKIQRANSKIALSLHD
ncbi:hypothetical protein, partial [Pediococcus ethanolidurans]|uniref:hypothetical protein n=1 Tax=Pediococcus ethanolidurans TaxID=319653 RepID=UPI0021AA119C